MPAPLDPNHVPRVGLDQRTGSVMTDNWNPADWEPLDFTNQTRNWRDAWQAVEGEHGVEFWDGDEMVLSWDHDDLNTYRQHGQDPNR